MSTHPDRQRRIRIVSNIIRVVALLGMISCLTAILGYWLLPEPPRITSGGNWKAAHEWLNRPLVSLVLFIPFVGLLIFYQLMGCFARGEIFSKVTVRSVRWIGSLMVLWWLIPMALQGVLLLLALEGPRDVEFTIDGTLLGGILVFLLAWILEEGRQLQEEQRLTI